MKTLVKSIVKVVFSPKKKRVRKRIKWMSKVIIFFDNLTDMIESFNRTFGRVVVSVILICFTVVMILMLLSMLGIIESPNELFAKILFFN